MALPLPTSPQEGVQPVQATAQAAQEGDRFLPLDGWRGLSILFVLACHLLPLGPKSLRLNEAAGIAGMSLFFPLSGFLITTILLRKPEVRNFLIRRLCRILPLAWGYVFIVFLVLGASREAWIAHLLFTSNYQESTQVYANAHLWSLCVEVQFYLAVAVLVAIAGRRGLYVLPLFSLAVTGMRIWAGATSSGHTHLRVDEILVGACLALALRKDAGWLGRAVQWPLRHVNPLVFVALWPLTCWPLFEPAMYLRPYLAGLMIGSTLAQPEAWLSRRLVNPVLSYLSQISYALYVLHPITAHGWMSTGSPLVRYLLKRPVSFALTFGLAHLSTFQWEARWNRLGRRWTSGQA